MQPKSISIFRRFTFSGDTYIVPSLSDFQNVLLNLTSQQYLKLWNVNLKKGTRTRSFLISTTEDIYLYFHSRVNGSNSWSFTSSLLLHHKINHLFFLLWMLLMATFDSQWSWSWATCHCSPNSLWKILPHCWHSSFSRSRASCSSDILSVLGVNKLPFPPTLVGKNSCKLLAREELLLISPSKVSERQTEPGLTHEKKAKLHTFSPKP